MARRHMDVRVLAVALSTAALLSAAPAARADVSGLLFTVAGRAHAVVPAFRFGELATDAWLQQPPFPNQIAGLRDGGFILATYDALWNVDSGGILHRFVAGKWPTGISDVAVTPDGSVLVATGILGDTIDSVRDGKFTRVAGGGHGPGFSGDGGPATRATLCDAAGVAVIPGGGVLIADSCNNRIRHVSPAGVIDTVARVPDPTSVAALPGGAFVVAEHGEGGGATSHSRAVLVHPDGTQSTVAAGVSVTALDACADGTFIAAQTAPRVVEIFASRVVHYDARGTELQTWGAGRDTGFDGDGQPASSAELAPSDISCSPADGGVLIVGGAGVQYIAPPSPRLLAVSIDRATLASTRHVRITYTTTRDAVVTARLLGRRGRFVAQAAGTASAGTPSFIDMPGTVHAGRYEAEVTATAVDPEVQQAHDRLRFEPGGLTRAAGRRVIKESVSTSSSAFGTGDRVGPCRAFGVRRVDCGDSSMGYCQRVATLRVHADGTLWLSDYGGYRRGRCRFARHPRIHDTEPVDP